MIINPSNPSKLIDASERVKFLRLTGRVVTEQIFLAVLAAGLEEGREVRVRKSDGSEVLFKHGVLIHRPVENSTMSRDTSTDETQRQ